jgi:lambda family phage tail tape measure protein
VAKQVEDIVVRLVGEGFEALDKIKGSFRELGKVTNLAERDILSARDSLLDFAKKAGNTEAVNKGLTDAFKGLRSQTQLCGDAYRELSADIEIAEAASRGYTTQALAQRDSLNAQYGAITNNTEALRRQRIALIELQQATRGGSQLFTQLGTDIERTTTRLNEIEGIQRRTDAIATRGLASSAAKANRDLADIRARIALERAAIDELNLLNAEGRRSFAQGELRGPGGVTRAIAERQQTLGTQLSQEGAIAFGENVRQRREGVRTANQVFSSTEYLTGSRSAENLNRTFGELPNTIAGINQGLSELRNRLDNTTIGTTAFTRAAVGAAAAQRELKESTIGVASALVQQLRTGDIAPSLTNLREVISSVRTEQALLNTNTTNGALTFQQLERQAQLLERQLSTLQATQTSLAASAVSGFAAFSQSITAQAGNRAVEGAIRRNRANRERDLVAQPRTFDLDIAALKKQLQELNVYERQYTEKLTEIQRRQIPFNAAVGRQNVIAGFESYQQGGMNLGQALPELPNTNAALAQSIQELTNRFANLVRGSQEWRDASKELKSLSRQSAEGFDTLSAGAREAKTRLDALRTSLKQVGSGFAEFSRNPLALTQAAEGQTAVQKSIERNRRKRGLLGAQVSEMPFGPAEPTELFRGIANIQGQSNSNQLQLMGRSYSEVATSIRQTSAASDSSLNSLRAQRAAWESLRNTLSGNRTAMRDVDKQLAQLDQRIERQSAGSRRRLTGSQLAQGAGAALSGGIFGGPEGLIGGLGGLAVGGVGGAFAGAAAGAQVGMFRQQLAGTADYAASIGKLQIALRGVVGSQAAYDAAIRSAAAATRDLNIPQEEATRGLTRLSAAVIGAGGTVADSSFAFRAMSEAIKATGGNAEQVDGALLALTQVFSKGKVSAEELNQIAERLPGTFTLFAQAAGKTGPELQKALEQGEVGLNDLMKFLALTGERYGKIALDISSSSQDAGARLTVAFQAMRLEVGNALQPLGAELQEAFADFIKDITPEVISSVKAIAEVIKFFTTNETAGGLARFALEMGAVALAIKGLQSASAGLIALNIAGWFTGAATGIRITGDAAAVAAPKVGLLKTALGGFVNLVSKPIVVTIVIASVIDAIKRISSLNTAFADFLKLSKQPIRPDAWLKSVGGDALSPERLKEFAGEASKALKFNTSELERLKKERATVVLQQLGAEDNIQQAILNTRLITINTEISNAEKRAKESQAKLNAIYGQLNTPKPAAAVVGTIFPSPAGEDKKDKASDKAARDAEAAAAEQQRLNESIAKARIALADAVFRNDMELIRKRYEYEQELEGKKRDLAVRSKTGGARESASLISGYFGELQTLTTRLTEAGQVVETATQDLKSAKSMAATTVGSAVSGGTSSAQTAQGYISKEQLRTYLISQGMGRTSGDFTNAGHRTPNHMLNAMDMGFTSPKYDSNYVAKTIEMERKLRATGAFGNQLFGPERDPRGHKDHLHVPTPGGKIPLTAGLASLMGIGAAGAGRQPTGVAAAARRGVAAEGGVDTAQANLNKALTEQALIAQQVKELSAVAGKSFMVDYTAAIREQNAALTDSASITELRNKLQLAGERPETIDAEIRKAEVIQRSSQLIADTKTELEGLDTTTAAGAQRATVLRDAIASQNTEIAKFKELTDAATAAQIAFNEAMRTRQDDRIGLGMQEGVQSYLESIGTMRQATEQLTVNGIKGVENAIFDLVTTGKTNFREFAADILKQTARMIIQQLVLGTIMRGIKALFPGFADGGVFAPSMQPRAGYAMGGGFAANNIIPYAKGGTFTNSIVSKPTLFKFAAGGTMQTGVMGEAGPEAIMPLSRGPNGKLGVASSGVGGTNVTVNVDASGSKVQGDSGKGEQLGRAVSQAVQDELLRQRRPGGILAT